MKVGFLTLVQELCFQRLKQVHLVHKLQQSISKRKTVGIANGKDKVKFRAPPSVQTVWSGEGRCKGPEGQAREVGATETSPARRDF